VQITDGAAGIGALAGVADASPNRYAATHAAAAMPIQRPGLNSRLWVTTVGDKGSSR
jgi:hypothetical protein